MKFTLDRQALETFNKGRLLEVEGLYSQERIRVLNHEIDLLLEKEKLDTKEEIMLFAHDLFRLSEPYKKALNLPALAQVIYELISFKPIRLVSDQLLECARNSFDQKRDSRFFSSEGSLSAKSSITDLILGVVIALKSDSGKSPFPAVAGNVTFFGPELPIPFDFLKEKLKDRYLLLAFSSAHAQYLFQEADPQNHYLKKLGYVYGDKLKDSLHPLIFR